jgi:rod shape determining protein RodA
MIIAALLLLSLGITVIYTSNPTLAIQQFIYGLVGTGIYFAIGNFDFRVLKVLLRPAYGVVIVLLLITLALGVETRGSVRWIPLGPFNLQPSEFAKPILILCLASFWSSRSANWKNIGKSLIIFIPIALLVFRQPDLGTTLTLGFIWFALLLSANISFFKLIFMAAAGAILAPLSWSFLQTYQKQRIMSFLSPTNDPQGTGFHVIQSMIAVGSGEIIGRGLGHGTQSRLRFLPEFQTDFIFAFIAEELGFIGSLIVLILYSTIFYLGFRLLQRVNDRFGELILIGVLSMLFFQIAINIGMNVGLIPITGITLPLLSYGGSSVLTTLLSLGLVSSVARFGTKHLESHSFSLIS